MTSVPLGEESGEIGTTDHAISIQVGDTRDLAGSPFIEKYREVRVIHTTIRVQVRGKPTGILDDSAHGLAGRHVDLGAV